MFVDFDICHQIVQLHKLYSVILTYFFKVFFFKYYIAETVRSSVKRVKDICKLWHLPSDVVIDKIALRDLYLFLKVIF